METNNIVDEIERQIACHEMSASQVFTQMRQLIEQEPKWISVEEKFPLNEEDLPESGFACIELLTSTCNGFVYLDEYQIGSMPRFWGHFQRNDVTHWMPLPSPPQGIDK